ncbi:MAG: AmmeMemoRadiSam system radical SAM enzyme [Candidatus Omnitrophica bacterium]|nr:AmmeMemoRadiSam system radical SAM enzyme [Candidatus Omnitrophota bacterium]MDD3987548.1 AmmeMemoRadiSam system radical SAM enzyme [Candidatus Omnitrophota bacterium]MDD4981517.1 AmmeMemoRadiSam system radical SAM enzyme [Candidatus Omnitrophota bacterium]MDD5665447.1 AmmeMemoRadiSam system radical SAM enzyme [Candidatus Omnitrophota bacterium]
MREALFYEKLSDKTVHCHLCAHECMIKDNKSGICGVRVNFKGTLFTYSYGNVVAANVDPIEKKPLYHFLPGSKSFSVASAGCNFKCSFCQNWEISQRQSQGSASLAEDEFAPEDIVEEALRNDCQSISYTYTEPTVFFEYAYDTARLAKSRSLHNVFVTNGYMSQDCLKEISPYLDAANVDLKFFQDSSYEKYCSASLSPVLETIKLMKELGVWVEITTLVIPGVNDSKDELKALAGFISGLDRNIPWHVSRFHPAYKLNEYPSTPEEILREARGIGTEAGLNFVYAGNVYGWGSDTLCPSCAKPLIKRDGFKIKEYNVKVGKCPYCQSVIPGAFPY